MSNGRANWLAAAKLIGSFECDRQRFHQVTAKLVLVRAALPLPKMFSLGQINTETKWVKTECFSLCGKLIFNNGLKIINVFFFFLIAQVLLNFR